MASQRVTVAKIGGVAGEAAIQRIRQWSDARTATDTHSWSPDQWPAQVRAETDEFAERLRANALTPPVVYFVEWSDLWSMGDLFRRWLSPPGGSELHHVHTNRYELHAYALPDGGSLARFLSEAGSQQWPETDWFVSRLREAVGAWDRLVERAVLVVLRHVVDGSASDESVTASLHSVPAWLA